MAIDNVGLKDYLVIGSLSGFLRMTSVHMAGYKQSDFTYWETYATWTVSSIVAILIYVTAMWLFASRKPIGTLRETKKASIATSGDARGRTTAQS